MIHLLELGIMGNVVFHNTQLTNFKGISGCANSNLKRGMLSWSWLGHKLVKITLKKLKPLMIDLFFTIYKPIV